MALTWTQFDMAIGEKISDAMAEFFANRLQTLTHWQNKGGGAPAASVLFDGGLAGGLLERKSDSKQFAGLYNYNWSGQTDRFQSNSFGHNNRFLSSFYLSTNQRAGAFMDNTGSRWADKTEFFGPKSISVLYLSAAGVTSGPFVRGETITIDAAGDNVTATLDDIINDQGRVILMISNCSAEPSSTWNTKTVTGGTSGASATTDNSGMPGRHWHVAGSNSYDLRGGPDFPSPGDLLTGLTTGHTAEVDTADASTGRITVINADGRFQINEVIEWGTAGEQASIGWSTPEWDVVNCCGHSQTDAIIDDTTCLIGEDADRLILLIPDTANSRYFMMAWGKFWDSAEGHGRMDGCFAGTPVGMFGIHSADAVGVFLDPNGMAYAHRTSLFGTNYQISALATGTAGDAAQSAGHQQPMWGNFTGGEEHDQPTVIGLETSGYDQIRLICRQSEFFTLPAETFRTVGEPGPWAGKTVLALHLDGGGRCIQFNNNALTP